MKFERMRIHFTDDVSATVTVVVSHLFFFFFGKIVFLISKNSGGGLSAPPPSCPSPCYRPEYNIECLKKPLVHKYNFVIFSHHYSIARVRLESVPRILIL